MDDLIHYYENNGPFRSRQHIINHVDMILGLSKTEQELDNKNRIIILFDRDEKSYISIASSELNDTKKAELRKKIILDSFYAKQWMQFILAEKKNGEPILSNSLKNDAEIDELLNLAFDVWEEQENGWDEFVNRTSIVVILLNWDSPVVDRIAIDRLPSEEELKDLPLAINTRNTLSPYYSSSTAWKAFTNGICKNEFMKKYLMAVQDNLCAVCKHNLEDRSVIHHVDYNHSCTFCNSGLEWKVPKTRVQPNCELCFNDHREWFMTCASHLRLLHNHCHYYIDHVL